MQQLLFLWITGITLALAPAAILAQQRTVILSTTTSTQHFGLSLHQSEWTTSSEQFPLEANAQISQTFDLQIPISN